MTRPKVEMMTDEQRRTLNAACGDLAAQIDWHGHRLSHDDFRHMLSGTVLGWRTVPQIDTGEGQAGFIMLGSSSLSLTKANAAKAIELAFAIGDCPEGQGLDCEPVRWCAVICKLRFLADE